MQTSGGAEIGVRRERRVLSSAVFIAGAAEVTDFMIPLYAGAALGVSATWIGLLLGAELAVSFASRPLAGVLADRAERRTVAAVGALLYALACVLYALAPGVQVMLLAAVVSGIGGSLLWVCVRAMVGERLDEDSGVFARLVSAEETGGWVVFVPAIFLVSLLDYRGIFFAIAACCLVAAVLLASAPARPPHLAPEPPPEGGPEPRLFLRLLPMLAATLVILTAEAVIALLLLLHLQREFGFGPVEVAYVFLPGGLALSILPPYLHGLVRRFGRTRMLSAASLASAVFAASLAFAPGPVLIAAFWVLAAAAWAVVLPVQQAVIAEASGPHRLGRGLGWYESASLGGGFLGAVAGGVLYDAGSWQLGCLVAAGIILAGAVIVPVAVRTLGVSDTPVQPPAEAAASAFPADSVPAPDTGSSGEASHGEAATEPAEPPKDRRRLLTDLAVHAALFGGALAAALLFVGGVTVSSVFDLSAQAAQGPEGYAPNQLIDWVRDAGRGDGGFAGLAANVLRVWAAVFVIDVIVKLVKLPKASWSGNG